MMVQLFFTFPVFICSSHSWIEIQRAQADRQRPEQKGGGVIDHLREIKSPFGVSYSSDQNSKSISNLRKRRRCVRRSVSKKPEFLPSENSAKGADRILHLCLRKINEKLVPRSLSRSCSLSVFKCYLFKLLIALLLSLAPEPGSQESTTVVPRFQAALRESLSREMDTEEVDGPDSFSRPLFHYIHTIFERPDRISLVRPDNTKSRKDLPPNPSGFFMWWRVSSTPCGHQHHFLHRKISGYFLFSTAGREFASRILALYPNLA